MGQGQPRVIIWTTLVVLLYTMLHTKFQGHWSIGSGEEDFLRFLPYMGMAAMLVMWPRSFEQLFFPKGPGGCIWNLVAIGLVVSEKKSFETVDGRRTDGRRTTEPAYTISSPGAFGSGELIKKSWGLEALYRSHENSAKQLNNQITICTFVLKNSASDGGMCEKYLQSFLLRYVQNYAKLLITVCVKMIFTRFWQWYVQNNICKAFNSGMF